MGAPSRHWLDAWHVNPSVNRDYDFIDGLRGIAILLVVMGHLVPNVSQAGPKLQFVGHLLSAGGFGVILFFALSGFLISWPFWKRKAQAAATVAPKGYGWRRFWKIYPPLALSMLLLTPLYILDSNDPSYARTAAQWLVGLPLVRPVDGRLNPVMWSLIVESHFYLVLPLVFLCFKRASLRVALWAIPLLFLVVPVSWRWALASQHIHYFNLLPKIDVHFPALLDSFVLGILIAGLENAGVIRKNWARLGNVGLVLLPLALLLVPLLAIYLHIDDYGRFEIVGWGVKIASGFLLCYVANAQHLVSRLLSQPWLRWIGIISYEWYLFHQALIHFTRSFFGPTEGDYLTFILVAGTGVGLSLLLAALVYRFYSLPILKFGRSRNVADRAAPAKAAEAKLSPERAAGTPSL